MQMSCEDYSIFMFNAIAALGGTIVGFSMTAPAGPAMRFSAVTLGALTWGAATYSVYYLKNLTESP
jgi:hypothetical protein